MSENTADQSSQERRVGPTVSRDKWYLHAKQKLSKGYVLIVARDGKKRANFWNPDKGFEMCAFDVARSLVASGEVVQTGEHDLGLVYTLVETEPAPTKSRSKSKSKAKAAPKPAPRDEDEPVEPLPADEDADSEDVDDEVEDADSEDVEDDEDLDDLDDDEDVKL